MVLLDLGDDFGGFAGFGRMIWVISQDLGGQLCHVTSCQDSKSRLQHLHDMQQATSSPSTAKCPSWHPRRAGQANLFRLLSDWGLADWGLVIPQNSAKFRKTIRTIPQTSAAFRKQKQNSAK